MEFRMKAALCAMILLFSATACGPFPKFIVLHDPLTLEEHITLGLSYEQKGEEDLALQEYKKAMKMSDEDFRPRFYAGNVYYKKKEYNSAEKYYNNALKIAPVNGDVHNNLAWVYLDKSQFAEAVTEAEHAVRIKRSPYYLNTLAHAYYRTGRNKEALEILEEAVSGAAPEDKALLDDVIQLMDELKQE